MTNVWDEIKGTLSALAGNWAVYVALGSFIIYLLGYLVVRFHLTVFGIGTDLAVLDERYLFAGAKFLVYLLSVIPILIFIILISCILILAIIVVMYVSSWILHLLHPNKFRVKVGIIRRGWRRILFMWSYPRLMFKKVEVETLAFAGIVFSILLIQLVMRQCFLFAELLLAHGPLTNHWFVSILLDETGQYQYYYFSGLVIGTMISLGIFLVAKKKKRRYRARPLVGLLGLLVIIEFLFLPINYGILVFNKAVPKVESLGGQQEITKCNHGYKNDCQEAWLVWEGTEGQTYLVRRWKEGEESRQLVTLPSKDTKKIVIEEFDSILTTLFGRDKGDSRNE